MRTLLSLLRNVAVITIVVLGVQATTASRSEAAASASSCRTIEFEHKVCAICTDGICSAWACITDAGDLEEGESCMPVIRAE